jgi:plastocyanin
MKNNQPVTQRTHSADPIAATRARPFLLAMGVVISLCHALAATAGDVSIKITDHSGAAVPNAVVALYGNAVSSPASVSLKAVMDQRNRQFAPHVLAVQRGTSVRFPNSDDIRHQVYSFSDAKRLNLPLYHGIPAEPVLFDQAGEVALGCNIHDRMLGYIYVVDTPWFVSTDDKGAAILSNVPEGIYVAKLWYPGLSEVALVINPALRVSVQERAQGTAQAATTLTSNLGVRENLPAPDASTTRGWGERRGSN